jgi:hypothetical protein
MVSRQPFLTNKNNICSNLPGGNVADGHGHVGWHDEEVSSELSLHTLNLRNQHDVGGC